ncbi:hypothetical protein CASFOL_003867 [Castilleja foliolosa]|uniref:AMP-activated protein kinase glycogen-binding domain-containing protein n=1 Tax=Castilleja foliolosa TaxID=1961234 RepID=A0ABD3EIS9_9LAMI
MMHSLTSTYAYFPNSHYRSFSRLNGPLFISSVNFELNLEKRVKNYGKAVLSRQYLGSIESWSGKNLGNTWSRWCKGEDEVELEAEIMDFMAKSEKPTMFPTKQELIGAGRADLAEAVEKKGGWYLLGYDVDENVEKSMDVDVDTKKLQGRAESCKESASLREHSGDSVSGDDNEDEFSSEVNLDFLQLDASASLAKSLEIGEDSGIEGILSRLEKQRNSDIGLNLEINDSVAHAGNKDDTDFDTSLGIDNGTLTHQEGKISQNSEPENWRTWSYQRAGFQNTEFEAAEISLSKGRMETDKESYHDHGMFLSTGDWYIYEQINYNQIRTRLQHLESELNSAFDSLRSKRKECISDEVTGSSSDLRKLSDECEFLENEFMSANETLRSMRAKLAVLAGKMALAIDAQKILDEKQKRIDGPYKASQLLRTKLIMYHSSASEVLLVGSFDGWTSQRKMERKSPGIFSLWLKLYPGRYEVKFIVDGVWKVDPLRPVVHNKGHENNIFIIT